VAVSFTSIFIRLAEAAFRLAIASLILAPAALTRGDLGLALLSGLFLSRHFAIWISSLEHTSVASSVVFVDTSPLNRLT